MFRKDQRGFTLIELLIVIVIIGILAGVLVSVINPAQQQNRARDANVKAMLNKVALATEGYISAYGKVPVDTVFLASLDKTTASGTTCSQGTDYDCLFTIAGNALPIGGTAGCAANGWNGSGAGQCYYRYVGNVGGVDTAFQVYAKSFGIVNTIFMYDNTLGLIQHCGVAGTGCVTP